MLRNDVTRAKSRLKALFRSRGLMPPGREAFQEQKHEAWATRLPKELRLSARVLLAELEALETLWAQAEERLREASKQHRIVKLLATAPAIGPIRSNCSLVFALTRSGRVRSSGGATRRRAHAYRQA